MAILLIIPILLWNIIFMPYLPSSYNLEFFNKGIPFFLKYGEAFFRVIVFTIPIFLKVSFRPSFGFLLYFAGSFLYYLSWLILMYAPHLKNIVIFAAPAYTPFLWLLGIAFMGKSYYLLPISYKAWHFIVPSALLIAFHLAHVFFVLLFRSAL